MKNNKRLPASDIVKLARKPGRISAKSIFEHVFQDFIELHGDRSFRDDHAVVGGIASLKGVPVTVIGIQKGADLDENIKRNFGSPHPEGYRKSLRLMKQAEKFSRPVITIVNTAGAFCGIGAEERGQGEAIARNLYEMSTLKTPVISIITGEGGSGGALALAVSDKVWMLENAIYSVLSPEGFASILWRDAQRAGEAAELMKLTSHDLLEAGVIDSIIPEHQEITDEKLRFEILCDVLREMLVSELMRLSKKSIDKLLIERYNRFRKFGEYHEG